MPWQVFALRLCFCRHSMTLVSVYCLYFSSFQMLEIIVSFSFLSFIFLLIHVFQSFITFLCLFLRQLYIFALVSLFPIATRQNKTEQDKTKEKQLEDKHLLSIATNQYQESPFNKVIRSHRHYAVSVRKEHYPPT